MGTWSGSPPCSPQGRTARRTLVLERLPVKLRRNLVQAAGSLLFCFASACEPSPDAGAAPSLPPGTWRLAPESELRIGAEGVPGHELDGVYGGFLRPDGSVLVGNSGTGELRVFDPSGRLALTTGRRGRGPGEFQGINWVQPYRGDSLLAFDLFSRQVSVWSQAGRFRRAFRLPVGPRGTRPIGVFADGRILMAAEHQSDPRQQPGPAREEVEVFAVSPEGEPGQAVGRFPGTEWLLYRHSQGFRATQIPFGQRALLAVSGDHVVYASSGSGRISVLDRSGRPVRTLDVAVDARKITRADVEAALAEIQDREERTVLRRHLDGPAGAPAAPVLTDLRVDDGGNLWVLTSEEAEGMARWVVLALSGGELGSVVMPASYMPLEIRGDRMLVRETDGDGVQRVLVRRVVR